MDRESDSKGNSVTAKGSRSLRLVLEYDGSSFCGWQCQDGQITVQQTLEEALGEVFGHRCPTITAGRTDSGVHAMGQTVSLRTESTLPPKAILALVNRTLPSSVALRGVYEAPPNFDARRDALARHYRFFLLLRRHRTALGRQFVTIIPPDVDPQRLPVVAKILEGEHDFQAFRSVACQSKRTCLTLRPIGISQPSPQLIVLDFSCRSFLHNMIRILTGTMINFARGRVTLEEIQQMLDTGQRHHEAITLPPQGLFLRAVDYPAEVTDCPGSHVSFPLDDGPSQGWVWDHA